MIEKRSSLLNLWAIKCADWFSKGIFLTGMKWRIMSDDTYRKTLELNEIGSMIPSTDRILYLVACSTIAAKQGKIDRKATGFQGFAVVTEQTFYLIKKPFQLLGKKPYTREAIPISQITGIDQTVEKYLTITSNHVKITRANNEDVLYGLTEQNARELVDLLTRQMNKPQFSNNSAPDPVEQLTKLASLLEKGLLTDEEFQKKKIELLGL